MTNEKVNLAEKFNAIQDYYNPRIAGEVNDTAVKLVRQCLDGFRIPKPTREADRYVRDLRRKE